jgi:hypothetical protein
VDFNGSMEAQVWICPFFVWRVIDGGFSGYLANLQRAVRIKTATPT